eukprot:3761104-Pyramimonas_sp.AAC.1
MEARAIKRYKRVLGRRARGWVSNPSNPDHYADENEWMEKCVPYIFRMLGLPTHFATGLAQNFERRMQTARDACESAWRRGGTGRLEL